MRQRGVAGLVPLEVLIIDAPPYANARVAHGWSLPEGFGIRYVRQRSGRKGAALNLGVSLAHADLLLFLDADIVLPPTVLASALAMRDSAGEWDILSALRRHEVMGLDVFSEPIIKWWKFPGPWFCLMEKRTLLDLGGWSDGFVEDTDMWIRVRRRGLRVGFVPRRVISKRPVRSQLRKSWHTLVAVLRTG